MTNTETEFLYIGRIYAFRGENDRIEDVLPSKNYYFIADVETREQYYEALQIAKNTENAIENDRLVYFIKTDAGSILLETDIKAIEGSEPTKDEVETLRYFLERPNLSNGRNSFERISKAEYDDFIKSFAFLEYEVEQKGYDVYLNLKERLK